VLASQQLGEASASGVLLPKMINGNQQLGHCPNSAEGKQWNWHCCQFHTVVHVSNLAAVGEQRHCGQRDSSGISLMQVTINWQGK